MLMERSLPGQERKDIQARCKALGLRATGSNDEMRLRLAEAEKETPSNPVPVAVLQGVEPMVAAAAKGQYR